MEGIDYSPVASYSQLFVSLNSYLNHLYVFLRKRGEMKDALVKE